MCFGFFVQCSLFCSCCSGDFWVLPLNASCFWREESGGKKSAKGKRCVTHALKHIIIILLRDRARAPWLLCWLNIDLGSGASVSLCSGCCCSMTHSRTVQPRSMRVDVSAAEPSTSRGKFKLCKNTISFIRVTRVEASCLSCSVGACESRSWIRLESCGEESQIQLTFNFIQMNSWHSEE